MSMTDHELLELAAKAAGKGPILSIEGGQVILGPCSSLRIWSPLDDDGDALRLAVQLGMSLRLAQFEEWTQVFVDDLYSRAAKPVTEHAGRTQKGQTIEQATRRAIVRAAAEIGKAMQEKH
ncbi:hypothetical protein [Pseudomonas asiatica]|uniref:hypothetical protein n=1 Tax=Pseudomonas asiatica TaxID=2219225 RepID=UPI001E297AC3|nr:hypothetical protein [Pseudomonas asiatica]